MTEKNYPKAEIFEQQAEKMSKNAAVSATSPISKAARRKLRGLGHALKPVVMVGQNGLTDALAKAIEIQLEHHELIKIKLQDGAPCSLQLAALWIHAAVHANIPQILGKTLLAYRPDPEEPTIQLPK